MEMSEIIRSLRLERGLTQEQLGNLIGVQKMGFDFLSK